MFFLQVHTVDTDHPLTVGIPPDESSTTSTISQRNSIASHAHTKFCERRGIVHLFRSVSNSSLPNPSSQSTILFVVAVPNYLSYDDFVTFCGSRINHVSELLFIRNDGVEERYSVLIKLGNLTDADRFFSNLNGKKFSPSEAEVCHILFLMSVEYTESAEVAGSPPDGCTELPTCPVCLERFDPDTSGIIHTLCDHSFHCLCISKWTSLSCQVCRFCQQQDEKQACFICGTVENLWVCVICGFLGCGRYKEGHAIRHWKNMHHCYSLDLRTQQIWDYVGDNYVHRLNQSKVDCKFGEMNPHCMSHEGECGTCEYDENSGFNDALYHSKVEAIVDEYNRLLATQLETQRQYYESLLAEAKSKKEISISEAVEEALISKTQDIQDKLEKCVKEKNTVSEVNQKLIKNQEMWLAKAKQIEERELASLKSRNEKIHDLEEQIRDLTVYIEAQKTLNNITDSDDIKGGTLLPVPAKESSPANGRKKKGNRRRS
ncbi:hypothetical protein IC582_011842 [Cucumis melo]|uniref:BRCA1-associated protein n=2 Tax=Cucumis melo TaxID=3656 RepID=A0A1S3C5L6_CUCME|nr:BRAP2 RING ZnF UBP domain-containing protein 1 [Cucumis melo]KAA0063536.1 BRCA1-associated protein [Cucumis melo var. makuwa]TYJ97863.1 BRCA1-associated protein [Cucumis melo var. makuwa]